MRFIINTNKREYLSFNGYECKVVTIRDDGFVEVYVPAFTSMIILAQEELIDE